MKTRWLTFAVLLAASLPAQAAYACSVCFDATDETRGAFLGTTIFLSLLPLGLIGGIGFYVFRTVRAAEAAAATERQAAGE